MGLLVISGDFFGLREFSEGFQGISRHFKAFREVQQALGGLRGLQ